MFSTFIATFQMASRAFAKIETERVIVKKIQIKLSTRNPQK